MNKGPPDLYGSRVVFDQTFKKLYLVGGRPKLEQSGSTDLHYHPLQFWIYDFKDKLWLNKSSSFQNSPSARYLHSLSIFKGLLYLFGGLDYQDQVLDDFYSFDAARFNWNRIYFPNTQNSPTGRFGHASVVVKSNIVIVGGKGDHGLSEISTLFYFSPESRSCTKYTTSFIKQPLNRYGHTATVSPDNKIFIVGGLDANDRPISDVSILDPLFHQWHIFPNDILIARAFHSAVAYGQALFLLFGNTEKSIVQLIKMDTSQILTRYIPLYSQEGIIDDGMPIFIVVIIVGTLVCVLFGIFMFFKSKLQRKPMPAETSSPASSKAMPSLSNFTDNFSSLGKFATGFWNTHLSNVNRFIDSSQQTVPNIDMSLTIDELELRPKNPI
ncbi:Multiple epidermal growth factor-like domains protein 8 [Entomophthora muscae]|uniref:Multiple epidermal growth factor-like domains protein 8 n=1 Tax=Entomophthora muscae TaxID=34485 RepID=A0ACC2TDJ4_9FUNG|nr:Multiple epidermal growth factor-like domains protein 8 [Entomophthora muscae]